MTDSFWVTTHVFFEYGHIITVTFLYFNPKSQNKLFMNATMYSVSLFVHLNIQRQPLHYSSTPTFCTIFWSWCSKWEAACYFKGLGLGFSSCFWRRMNHLVWTCLMFYEVHPSKSSQVVPELQMGSTWFKYALLKISVMFISNVRVLWPILEHKRRIFDKYVHRLSGDPK